MNHAPGLKAAHRHRSQDPHPQAAAADPAPSAARCARAAQAATTPAPTTATTPTTRRPTTVLPLRAISYNTLLVYIIYCENREIRTKYKVPFLSYGTYPKKLLTMTVKKFEIKYMVILFCVRDFVQIKCWVILHSMKQRAYKNNMS